MTQKKFASLESQQKVASTIRSTLGDKDWKTAEAQLSDYVKLRVREESLLMKILRTREDVNMKSREVIEIPDLVDDAHHIFKGYIEGHVRMFVRTKLAKYAAAHEGTFTRNAEAQNPRREYAYFPIVRLHTDIYEFDLRKLDIHSDMELITEFENDLIYAMYEKIDAVGKRIFDDALTRAPGNLSLSLNTNAQREDWKRVMDIFDTNKLRCGTLVTSETRMRDIMLYPGTEFGDDAGGIWKDGQDFYKTLWGKQKETSVTSPIVSDNKRIYALADPEYIGDFFIINPLEVLIEEDKFNKVLKMKATMDIATGLANIFGLSAVEFA